MDTASSLHRYFGFSSFRAGQQEAIQTLLNGNHTLVVMPTGAGKSLIFQLVALQLEGLTLVISPLIALMQDQVDSLLRRNISATYINSALPVFELNQRLQNLSQSKYRLVYVAPERLRNVAFMNALRSQKISLLAVDEAHCISEWGHDFRPDYLHIAQARASLGDPLTVALTATATPQVQTDILRLLRLSGADCIITGFNRPNLTLEVKYVSGLPAKLQALKELLSSYKQDRQSGLRSAVIIYTGTRRDAEEVTEFVREVIKLPAEFYHAGLLPEERTRIQNDFTTGKLSVICATNAFGMGIDRADVRQVIHYSMPGSLEAYYQEAGRAGRDGQPSRVTLLYDPEDRALQEFFINSSILTENDLRAIHDSLHSGEQVRTTIDELSRRTGLHPVQIRVGLSGLERAAALEHLGEEGLHILFRKLSWNPGEIGKAILHGREHLRHRQLQLDGIVRYAESNSCRRIKILDHFGDHGEAEAVDCCDNCQTTASSKVVRKTATEMSAGERAALVILDCICKAHTRIGRRKLAQILHGSKAQDILKFHHDRNMYYRKLAAIRQNDIEEWIGQLIQLGYIKAIGGQYPILSLTPQGQRALEQKEAIPLKAMKRLDATKMQKASSAPGMEYGRSCKSSVEGSHPKVPASTISVERVVELGEIKPPGAVTELIHALENPNGNIRRLAASALGKIRDARAVEPLLKLLACESKPQVRQYAVKALGEIGDQRAEKCLLEIAENEKDMYYTRNAARYSLKKLHRRINPSTGIDSVKKAPSREHTTSPDTSVESFLSNSHPRPLTGPWQTGWALGFHSRFTGGNWIRSGIGDLAYRLKYEGDTAVLPELLQQALNLLDVHPEMRQANLLIPVPSSTWREVDPVHVFCESLAGKIGLPLQRCVIKIRRSQPQKEMKTLAQKRSNVAGAFAICGDIRDRRVLLVDDLFDSGATLEEITRLLFKHGALRVNVLTLTRTIHSDA